MLSPLSPCLSLSLSLSLSVPLSVSLCLYVSVSLSLCLSVYLSLSVCLSVCLSLSVSLSLSLSQSEISVLAACSFSSNSCSSMVVVKLLCEGNRRERKRYHEIVCFIIFNFNISLPHPEMLVCAL